MKDTSVRLRVLLGLAVGALMSCGQPDSALRVRVTVRPQGGATVRADCLRVAVLNDSQELKAVTFWRNNSDEALVGVRRGKSHVSTIKLQATGWLGDCDDESSLKLNARGEAVSSTFPASGVEEVQVFVDPPGPSLDADGDGYVAASKGGPDCRDDVATIFPGAGQICSSYSDTDCDGAKGCDDSECVGALACANPAERVGISSSVATMLRYECRGPFRIELLNASGPRPALRDTAIALTTSLPGVTVHATSSCTDAPQNEVTVSYGEAAFDVYLAADAQAFGTATLTAVADGIANQGMATVEVHPQPIDHLSFTSSPRTVTAGQCGTDAVTLEFRDALNRRTDVDGPTLVSLFSTPSDASNANVFFSDASCGRDGSKAALEAGQGTVTLYLKARRAGTLTLQANPSAGTSATQSLTVLPGPATQLAFINAPLVLVSSQPCSPGSLQLQLQDEFQNAVTPTADVPLQLDVTGLTGVDLFTGAGCVGTPVTAFTLRSGSPSLSVPLRGTMASATAGQVRARVTGSTAIAETTQPLWVNGTFASAYAVTGLGQTVEAGTCSAKPFAVELRDGTGAPASLGSAMTFALSTLPAADASLHFYRGAGCQIDLGSALTIPAGEARADVYFRGTRTLSNFEIRATAALTPPPAFLPGNSIVPAAPAKLMFADPLTQTTVAGVCTASPFVAGVFDAFDNRTHFDVPQVVTVSSSPAGVTVGANTCVGGSTIVLSAGVEQASFLAQHTATNAGVPYRLTATVGGFSTVPQASLQVNPGPSSLRVEVPANAAATVAAGSCQTITVARRDAFGNPAPTSGPTPVDFDFPTGTQWTVYSSANCSGAAASSLGMNGTHTLTFSVSPKTGGTHPVTVLVGTGVEQQMVTLTLTVTAGAPALVFEQPSTGSSVATAAQTAGDCTPISVARKDSFGNEAPLPAAQDLAFTLAPGTTMHTGTPCMPGNSVSSVPWAAGQVRGTVYVRGTKSSPSGGPLAQTVTLTLQALVAQLTLSVGPGLPRLTVTSPSGAAATLTANECLNVTLERRDEFMNPVPLSALSAVTVAPSAGLQLFSGSNCTSAPVSSIAMPVGAFASNLSLRAQLAGSLNLTLSLDGQTTPLNLTVTPGPTSQLQIEGLPSSMTARACVGPLTVRRVDAWNNPVVVDPELVVSLSSTRFSFSSQSNCSAASNSWVASIPAGTSASATAFYVLATQAGLATMLANASAPGGAVSGMASSTVMAGAAVQLAFVSAPSVIVAGQCSPPLQVEMRDQDGNSVVPPAGAPVSLLLSSTPHSLSFFSGASCTGSLPAQLTNAAPVGTFSFRPTVAPASEMIQVDASGLSGANQTWSVQTGAPAALSWKQPPEANVSRFSCVSAGVLELKDAAGNVTPASAALAVTPSAGSSASMTFFTDATCMTPATSLTVNAGQSQTAQFYMFATGAGAATVSATAAGLTDAPAQPVNVSGSLGILALSATNTALEAGGCLPLKVERRNSSNGPLAAGTTTLEVAVPSGTTSVTLHSTADCSGADATSQQLILGPGQSSGTVYARGRSADAGSGLVQLTVTARDVNGGSTAGTLTLDVHPLVRRTTCDFAGGDTIVHCPLSPPIPDNEISRSFLVFTSTGSPSTSKDIEATNQAVECHLDVGKEAEVVCSRVGGVGAMLVNAQVVSWGRAFAAGGVSVQHLSIDTSGPITQKTITPVDRSQSFILTSSSYEGDSTGDTFPLVGFASDTQVNVLTSSPITKSRRVSVQVVSFAGASVTHATLLGSTGNLVTVATGTSPLNTTFVLGMAQVLTDRSDVNLMCKRRFRGQVSASEVTFRRGSTAGSTCTGDAVSALVAQRVVIPSASVQAVTVRHNTSLDELVVSDLASPVERHRSISFMGMQGPGGQTAGEGAYADTHAVGDDTGPFHAIARISADGTQVNVRRTPVNAPSDFTVFVVQFRP